MGAVLRELFAELINTSDKNEAARIVIIIVAVVVVYFGYRLWRELRK